MFLALDRPTGRLDGMSSTGLAAVYAHNRAQILGSGVQPPVYGPAFWAYEPNVPAELRPHPDDERILPGEDVWGPNIERHEKKRAARQRWLRINGFVNPERVV
jgi:hypothetical protein